MDADSIQDAATKKYGPLPAWGWGAVVVGGALGWRVLRGRSGGVESGSMDYVANNPSGGYGGGGAIGTSAMDNTGLVTLGDKFGESLRELREQLERQNAGLDSRLDALEVPGVSASPTPTATATGAPRTPQPTLDAMTEQTAPGIETYRVAVPKNDLVYYNPAARSTGGEVARWKPAPDVQGSKDALGNIEYAGWNFDAASNKWSGPVNAATLKTLKAATQK